MMVDLAAVAVGFAHLRSLRPSQDEILVFAQIYDRGVGAELIHAARGRCNVARDEPEDGCGDDGLGDHLHLHTLCACHDAHNSMKWG
eukprot:5004451-Amphidinium_carterae.1